MADAPITLYDWQQADVDRAVASINPAAGALIVSDPGAGKTVVAVEILKALAPEVTLIIAPPSTHESAWGRTLRRQGFPHELKPMDGSAKFKKNFEALKWGEPGVYITSAQWFTRQDWKHIKPDAIVADEVHMLAAYGNAGQKKFVGTRARPGITAPVRIALSGTPFRNTFENAWSVVRWVEPAAVNPEYWAWRIAECVGDYDHFAPQNLKVKGERVPGQLVGRLTCYISHSQRSNCCDFHPNGFLAHLAEPIRIERNLTMTPDQARFYRSMEKSYVGMLQRPGEDGQVPIVAELPIVARGMLRFCALALPRINEADERLHFAEDCQSPKLDAVLEDLEQLEGRRVLALTHSAQFAQVAAARLERAGYRVVAWDGKLTQKRRREALADFLAGELDVIVGVISAMGTGTDGLQEAAYNVMWLSVDDDASNNVQGVGRLDRLGQTHQVVMFDYRMLNTFDVGHLDKQLQRILDLNKSLRAKEKA